VSSKGSQNPIQPLSGLSDSRVKRSGPIGPRQKTHLAESQPRFPEWLMTLCGSPAERVGIAKAGEKPTCKVCFRMAHR
jgi:hypothetical protein